MDPAPAPNRIVPLIISVALFMEQMDSTVIATSLPAIASSMGVDPLTMSVGVTSYLLTVAIFLPASGWVADRFGARNIFRLAIVIFMIGSITCALSPSLAVFVAGRVIQGIGGALMMPVGRMVLVRVVDRQALLEAMTWLTIPGLMGPMFGPPLGGFITTYFSWHWIFLINIPIGLIGLVLVTRFIPTIEAERPGPFDIAGMALLALGLSGLVFGLAVVRTRLIEPPLVAGMFAASLVLLAGYVLHARRMSNPVLNLALFQRATFRVSVAGGFIARLTLGALPYLLAMQLQVGFHYTPFQSGLVTLAGGFGSLASKPLMVHLLGRLGFWPIIVYGGLISAVSVAFCGLFTAATPYIVMIGVLFGSGFFRAIHFMSLTTIAYDRIAPSQIGQATALAAVGQQLSMTTGVAMAALLVQIFSLRHDHVTPQVEDFQLTFFAVAAITSLSVLVYRTLPAGAGAELVRKPAPSQDD